MRLEYEKNITYIRRRGRTLDPTVWEQEEVVREEETEDEKSYITLKGK
jgi:hypothetical protein